MPALLIVLALAAVGAIAYFSYMAKKKRREEISALAAKLGLKYDAGDPFSIDESMPHRLLGLGEGRDCENVIWGVWEGLPVTAFDYWYYTTSTDSEGRSSRTYYRFDCVMTQIPANCAHLIVTKENLFTRMADSLGFHDIEFETEEFNKAWQVKCPDRKFANDFLDQRMMEWLMYAGTEWSFEIVGPIALIYTGKLPTSQLMKLLQCCKSFKEKIPRVVYELYPASAGSAPPGTR